MPSILVFRENHWLVNIYRGMGVFNGHGFDAFEPRSTDLGEIYQDILKADVCYFLRTSAPGQIEAFNQCRAMGKPTWYDIDDDFFNVSRDSMAYGYYAMDGSLERVEFFLKNADVVTVSTEYLKRQFDKYRPSDSKCVVIPNAIDDLTFKNWSKYPEKEPNNTVVWRGGGTHQMDLMYYANELNEFADMSRLDEMNLNFYGFDPFWITIKDGKPRENCKAFGYKKSYYEYMMAMREVVRPLAVVVPLRPCEFNYGKSNIAALEAVYAGAIPIVPDWEEWKCFTWKYKDKHELSIGLTGIRQKNPVTREKAFSFNCKGISEKYVLSVTNKKREEIIQKLTGKQNVQ
jgi:hypothetical protein